MMSSSIRHDNNDDGDSFSEDESSSFEDDRHSHRRRHKSKKRKKSSNKRSSSSRKRHHKDSKHDKRKSDKKHGKKRRGRHRDDYDDDDSATSSRDDSKSDSDSISASADESRDKKKKRHRRRKESSSRRHKKKKRKRRHNDKDDDDESETTTKDASKNNNDDDHDDPIKIRNRTIVSALSDLLKDHPVFSEELPVLLIRLAGGTTFELRQMNDVVAAQALSKVLASLEVFGVTKRKEDGMWMFSSGGSNNNGASDPLILLKLIRACMNDVGISMEAIEDYETKETKKIEQQHVSAAITTNNEEKDEQPNQKIKDLTIQVLVDFSKEDSQLGLQLADLCRQIAQGESVSIDGIPDPNLKSRLESIFVDVGLEKSEMIFDDDSSDDEDDDDNNIDDSKNEKVMGYGLPGDVDNDIVQIKLAAVMEACRSPVPEKKKRVLGPMRGPPPGQAVASIGTAGDSDEDEGPLLPGVTPRRPIMAPEDIRAQAERRELELKATAAGVSIPVDGGGGREEWMIVPGEHDFLSNIKAGQSIKSRQFQNKKVRGGKGNNGGDGEEAPIHPAIRAEMEAIKKAHEEARGPSLIEQHRAKKKQEKEEAAAASGKKKSWGWNRENDLDAGRRVDKDALHMVLGGAADNLKTKFQGGFNR